MSPTGSILLLPERNEDNTAWLSHEVIKPATVFNKMKPDDIATVHKRKQILTHEVTSSVVDQWLRDQVNRKTWEKNIASFPEGFGTVSDYIPRKRSKTDHRYFQEQIIGNVNYPWMPEAHEMPAEGMSHTVSSDKLARRWVWGA
jgi:hypothetical protein